MGLTVEWPGLARLTARLDLLKNHDPLPVLEKWETFVVEGNRRGVLSGLDGNDQPAPPLKYRGGAGKPTRNRQVATFGQSRFPKTGQGLFATGLHDNLSPAEYRKLDGPRLAPRREQSRTIKNLKTEVRHPSDGRWEVVGSWDDVVSVRGVKFLGAHFHGTGRLPRYDLRPIRPRDWQFCVNALRDATRQLFFEAI